LILVFLFARCCEEPSDAQLAVLNARVWFLGVAGQLSWFNARLAPPLRCAPPPPPPPPRPG
jgi:hypothetical protein